MKKCLYCGKIISKHLKFCNRSHAASFNNKGRRRHGKDPGICAYCGGPKSRSVSMFCSNRCHQDSKGVIKKVRTKEEYNAYMRQYMLKRYHTIRGQIVNSLGGKCVFCNSIDNLEIDHIDRKMKQSDMAKIWSYAPDKLSKELAKCRLLCHSCHIDKSIAERGFKKAKGFHGTISTARYCNCDSCKEAKKKYMQQRNAKAKKAKELP